MQKKIGLSIILIKFVLLALILTPTISGEDIPVLPHQFYGYVYDENGELISNGNVTATLNDKTFTTQILDGKYGFQFETEAFLIQGDSGDAGDLIYFYINDSITSQTAVFQAGGINDDYSTYMNLSFDADPPIISSVSVSSITSSQAIVSWITNENSNSTVGYGTSKQLGNLKKAASFVKNHEIILDNLEADTIYYFEVISSDISGNIATDDNSSNYYSFRTSESSQNGGNNGGTSPGGNGGTPVTPPVNGEENIPPTADAGGRYYKKVNQTVTFDASASSDSDGYIVEYFWDFGDGTTQKTTETRITHMFSMADNYTVMLTVTDNALATNTTTTIAYISDEDSDGDGWTDEAEEYYHRDPNDPNDYPIDSDGDGVPDGWDADDDNDGLSDLEEETIGTNSSDGNDVLRILNDFDLFYLLDTDSNGIFDKYYNQTMGYITNLKIEEDSFLIDIDNDNNYEYKYDKISGGISRYNQISENSNIDNSFILAVLGILILVVIIIAIWRKRIF